MPKKKQIDFAVDVPPDFSGEVSVSRSHATPSIEPLTQDFNHGDLTVLKNKINEIIKIITG
jgi:hypothetical protein